MQPCHRVLRVLPLFFVLCSAPSAFAHKPLAVGALDTSPEKPLALFDINISQVVYYEPTVARPRVWTKFHAEAGQVLMVQPGIPQLAGHEDVRPAFAVLGPGLPEVELPFQVPTGIGGTVYTTEGDTTIAFDEPFTGTKDWQLAARNITLPVTGDYYLVGYLPNAGLDKFWIAVGEDESFSFADIVGLPGITIQVRQFHDVFPLGGIALLLPMGIALSLLAALVAKLAG